MIKQLNRRALLLGAGGATLSLPFLEYFLPKPAQAAPADFSRLILCYSGQAMGGDRDNSRSRFVPDSEGSLRSQPLPLSLQPLGGRENWPGTYTHSRHGPGFKEPVRNWEGEVYDVRDKVSVVSGMHIPLGNGVASAPKYHHRGTVSAHFSGKTSKLADKAQCWGSTADVIFEDTMGSAPSLRCVAQAHNYGNGAQYDNTFSYRSDGNGGTDPIGAQVSPAAMYNSLFGGFIPPDQTASAAQVQAAARRQGVLDLILPAAHRLDARLGVADRARLEAHLDGLSTLRNRIDSLEETVAACELPPHPGDDPSVTGGRGGDGSSFNEGEGWSQENKRAEAFIDMMVMAMACDMTRSATLMFSYHQSFLNGEPPTGLRGDQHQIGHGGNVDRANGSANDSVALCHHYPVRYFGYLVGKLASVEVAPDRTLLDECAAGLFFEAGHGMYEGGMSAHSGDEMCALLAGGVGGLRMGEHIRLLGEHPASVLTSMLDAVGCEPQLGDIGGRQARLFV